MVEKNCELSRVGHVLSGPLPFQLNSAEYIIKEFFMTLTKIIVSKKTVLDRTWNDEKRTHDGLSGKRHSLCGEYRLNLLCSFDRLF